MNEEEIKQHADEIVQFAMKHTETNLGEYSEEQIRQLLEYFSSGKAQIMNADGQPIGKVIKAWREKDKVVVNAALQFQLPTEHIEVSVGFNKEDSE